MIKLLLKIQARALLNSTFKGKKTKANKPKLKTAVKSVLIALLVVYVFASLLASAGAIFYLVFKTTAAIQQPTMYFTFFAFVLFFLCAFGSIFTVQNCLFEAKDNDLLLSMPIRPRDILFSRFLLILLIEYGLTLLVSIPAAAVFCYFQTPTFSQALLFVLSIFLLPLFSLTVACVIGWLLTAVTSRIRHKSLFYVPLVVLFFVGYMYLFSDPDALFTSLITSGSTAAIFRYIPPVILFGEAVFSGDYVSFIWLSLWCIPPAACTLTIFSKLFIRIATTKRGLKKLQYVEKPTRTSSPLFALTKKELRRFFSLPAYIINSALGIIMAVLLCGYLVLSKDEVTAIISSLTAQGLSTEELAPYVALVMSAMLVCCASFSVTTSCSISLEGDRLWILQSLPLSPRTVFAAKLLANLVITYPILLLSSLCCALVLPLNFLQTLLLFVLPVCAQATFSLLGLAANVRFPYFHWTNETAAIKQGLSTLIGMLGSMLLAALPVVLYFIWIPDFSPILFMFMYLVYLLLIAATLFAYLLTSGARRFATL